MVTVGALIFGLALHGHIGAAPHLWLASAALDPASPGTIVALPGRPSRLAAVDVYAHTGTGQFAPATAGVLYRLYVPERRDRDNGEGSADDADGGALPDRSGPAPRRALR